jgi:hypothetical protein
MKLALRRGQLIDGTGGAPVADGTVVMDNAVIRAAGADVRVPAGFTTVRDLSGLPLGGKLAGCDAGITPASSWAGQSDRTS